MHTPISLAAQIPSPHIADVPGASTPELPVLPPLQATAAASAQMIPVTNILIMAADVIDRALAINDKTRDARGSSAFSAVHSLCTTAGQCGAQRCVLWPR
jgi:hypothetical protein